MNRPQTRGDDHPLFAPLDAYATGMLDVGDGHVLYYERVGTRGAKQIPFAGYYSGAERIQRANFLEYGDSKGTRSSIASVPSGPSIASTRPSATTTPCPKS